MRRQHWFRSLSGRPPAHRIQQIRGVKGFTDDLSWRKDDFIVLSLSFLHAMRVFQGETLRKSEKSCRVHSSHEISQEKVTLYEQMDRKSNSDNWRQYFEDNRAFHFRLSDQEALHRGMEMCFAHVYSRCQSRENVGSPTSPMHPSGAVKSRHGEAPFSLWVG